MYIHSKPIAAFYKLAIGTISLFSEWYLLSQFGWSALRLFPTWVLFIAAIYYLSSALHLATSHHKEAGRNLCPMLEGMIILSFLIMSGMALAAENWHFYLPSLPSAIIWLICPILSTLTLLDWLLFVKKGRWQIMMPFYWIALPFAYAGTMMLTAEWMHESATLRYPLEMFNYLNFGLWEATQCLIGFFVLAMITAYILYIVDFALSGKVAKHIVLPHIRVVEVDEVGVETAITQPSNTEATISQPNQRQTIRQPEQADTTNEPDITAASEEAIENLAKLAAPQGLGKSAKNLHKSEAQKSDKIEVIRIKMNNNKSPNRKNTSSNRKRRPANNRPISRSANSQANHSSAKTSHKIPIND